MANWGSQILKMLGGLQSGKEKVHLDAQRHKRPKEPGSFVVQRIKTLEKPLMKSGGLGFKEPGSQAAQRSWFIHSFFIYVYKRMKHRSYSLCVEVKGQFSGISSLLMWVLWIKLKSSGLV